MATIRKDENGKSENDSRSKAIQYSTEKLPEIEPSEEKFLPKPPEEYKSDYLNIRNNNVFLYHGLLIFRNAMLIFIVEQLRNKYHENWWEKGVREAFEDKFKGSEERRVRGYEEPLPVVKSPDSELHEILDIGHFPRIIIKNWDLCFADIFGKKNEKKTEVWLNEIREVRNKVAHPESIPISDEDTLRAFDNMIRFLRLIDNKSANQIAQIKQDMLRKPNKRKMFLIICLVVIIVSSFSFTVWHYVYRTSPTSTIPPEIGIREVVLKDTSGTPVSLVKGAYSLDPGQKVTITVDIRNLPGDDLKITYLATRGQIGADATYIAPNAPGSRDIVTIRVVENNTKQIIYQEYIRITITDKE